MSRKYHTKPIEPWTKADSEQFTQILMSYAQYVGQQQLTASYDPDYQERKWQQMERREVHPVKNKTIADLDEETKRKYGLEE